VIDEDEGGLMEMNDSLTLPLATAMVLFHFLIKGAYGYFRDATSSPPSRPSLSCAIAATIGGRST
jgi:hypothetical protein